ncbi:Uma2 family endonuclease [Desulfitobacterium sp.]|uniref:Uma2 family endonuclease n=1 Tax=Desulfitobacterium sp. TaxID=49981 RepID=UPI002D1928A4|nr:Uma2 family endonuclease [Desulfitobacterium sp.]HVJ48890.1 Uma2 family endonuclease [Desulfitobacterium sp.]
MPIPHQTDKKYTYADYLTWPENERWEIIDGTAYMQSAPTWQHQSISRELLLQFGEYLRNRPCQVFAAPFDLRLPESEEKDEDVTSVLQPDITIVCDSSKLKGTGYYGTPDLIIEIISPSTGKMDRLYKFNKYEKAGVKEYWIVEPENKLVSVFIQQENQRYGRPDVYSEEDKIKVSIFPDLVIDLKPVFGYTD